MSKIYLVSSGQYSDYYVSAAFSTRELADLFIAAQGYPTEFGIEERELDPNAAELRSGRRFYTVQMDLEGNVTDLSSGASNVTEHAARVAQVTHYYPQGQNKDGPQVTVGLFAPDDTTAVKIANEQRLGFLADPLHVDCLHEIRGNMGRLNLDVVPPVFVPFPVRA